MLHSWDVVTYTLDTGAGTKQILVTLDAYNLSRCECLELIIKLTKADTAGGDTLDVYLEETVTRAVTWDQRVHSHQFIGTMSPSTTAPEVRRYRVQADTVLNTSDSAYETTGSAGSSDIAAGSVRHGPFAPPYNGTNNALTAVHRIRIEQVQGGVAADFEGTITLRAWTRC